MRTEQVPLKLSVLVVGGGGREHAIAWKLSQRQTKVEQVSLDRIFVWPGNACTQQQFQALDLSPTASNHELMESCKTQGIDLVVIGPENFLDAGLADLLRNNGIAAFGASQAAAKLESSKSFAKEVMAAANVPTAAHKTVSFDSLKAEALDFFEKKGAVVIKASGLAAGKGVFVCHHKKDIEEGVSILSSVSMRASAEQVVLEEELKGRECSYFCFVGEGRSTPIGFAVDFKRLEDGDKGPNTGGMGCYTPVPWLPSHAGDLVEEKVVKPVLAELNKRGIDYNGCLYVGLMWSDSGPNVVEFNVRLGDPEAQVLAVSDSRDWLALIAQKSGLLLGGNSDWSTNITFKPSVCRVMASASYPYGQGKSSETHPDLGLDFFSGNPAGECHAFAASVLPSEDPAKPEAVRAGSGRVLSLVASGETHKEAKDKTQGKLDHLIQHWIGLQYRKDIASKVINESNRH